MLRGLIFVSGLIGGTALFAVMALVFVAVGLRYFFGIIIPDTYDLSRMLLGILIFWGIALAVAENSMIKIDAVYGAVGTGLRRVIRMFAAVVTAVVLGAVAWRAGLAVEDAFGNKVSTSDLRLRLWPFYGIATIALFLAVMIAIGRMINALTGAPDPEDTLEKEED